MIAVIGDSETASGFRLAGITKVHECSPDNVDVTHVLDKLVRDEVAVVIISERIAALARNKEKIRAINAKKSGAIPVIIEIPDKKGPMVDVVDEIGLLIKRAVGVAIK
jgi:V/A-type H+-transporting ATPase subunit F